MKDVYYSIGEVSKLANISIQTLRYYDQIDLFKPSYVDKTTNYRYYKDSQIFHLDLIKSLKSLGSPLDKIKEAQNLTPNQLLDFLRQQEAVIEQKMRELQAIQDGLYQTKRQMEQQLAIKSYNAVFEKDEAETKILKIKTENLTPLHIPNAYYSSLKRIVEDEGSVMNIRYGCTYALQDYSSVEELFYESVFTPLLSSLQIKNLSNDMEHSVIPAGNYVCIAFVFTAEDYFSHYKKLYDYINERNIAVHPEVFEIFMPTNYSPKRADEFIVEIKVRKVDLSCAKPLTL